MIGGLVVASRILAASGDNYPTGDGALLELFTLETLRGHWRLGPYSRFGWHHPGPLLFYALAPLYIVSGFKTLAMWGGALAISVGAVASATLLMARRAMAMTTVLAATALVVFVWRLELLAVNYWNPFVIVLPTGTWLVACAALSTGSRWILPALVVLGSFLVQTHVSVAPMVAITGVVAAAWGFTRADRAAATDRVWRWWALAAIAALVVWWAPLVEELSGAPGNLTQLLQFFRDGGQRPDTADAVAAWSHATTGILRGTFSMPSGTVASGDPAWVAMAAFLQVAALMAVAWRFAREGAPFESRLSALVALALATGLWSLTRARGPLLDYLAFWLSIAGALGWASIAAWIFHRARRTSARASAGPSRLAVVAAVVTSAVTLVQGLGPIRAMYAASQRPPVQDAAAVLTLADGVSSEIARTSARRPMLRVDQDVWSIGAGVLLELRKRRVDVVVDLPDRRLLPPSLTPHGDEDRVFVVRKAGGSAASTDAATTVLARAAPGVVLETAAK